MDARERRGAPAYARILALTMAAHGAPEIFNTDQGSQFTSLAFTGRLQAAGIRISMDGRGRFMDNIFIERLWRSLKYEVIYLHEIADGRFMDNIFIERLWRSLKYEVIYLHEIADGLTARRLIRDWVVFYNAERPTRRWAGGPRPRYTATGRVWI